MVTMLNNIYTMYIQKIKERHTKAVDNINFTVDEGEFIGIMGACGSGKPTLLNCISTIDCATAGNIFNGYP